MPFATRCANDDPPCSTNRHFAPVSSRPACSARKAKRTNNTQILRSIDERTSMKELIESLLQTRWFVLAARVILTFVFWSAGLAGIFDFPTKVAEMRSVGLPAPELFAVVVTIVQLGGSILIIANKYAWLGAGALGVFLALTIPFAHAFWTMSEPQRTFEFYVVLEHISIIGGLMVAAALSSRRAP